jgi:hypothetical protein
VIFSKSLETLELVGILKIVELSFHLWVGQRKYELCSLQRSHFYSVDLDDSIEPKIFIDSSYISSLFFNSSLTTPILDSSSWFIHKLRLEGACHPLAQNPLDANYDSVMDEPQLSYYLVPPW